MPLMVAGALAICRFAYRAETDSAATILGRKRHKERRAGKVPKGQRALDIHRRPACLLAFAPLASFADKLFFISNLK
jgi:hypothetical protein